MSQDSHKMKPGIVSVDEYLAELDEKRLEEAVVLIELMRQETGEEPVMWGSTIVGFGSYHYKYESGHEGDAPLVGFSARKAKISLYLTYDIDEYREMLDAMGKYSNGKSCIYVNSLNDVDIEKLRELIAKTYRDNKRKLL